MHITPVSKAIQKSQPTIHCSTAVAGTFSWLEAPPASPETSYGGIGGKFFSLEAPPASPGTFYGGILIPFMVFGLTRMKKNTRYKYHGREACDLPRLAVALAT